MTGTTGLTGTTALTGTAGLDLSGAATGARAALTGAGAATESSLPVLAPTSGFAAAERSCDLLVSVSEVRTLGFLVVVLVAAVVALLLGLEGVTGGLSVSCE